MSVGRVIVVLGMHRSGTSVSARALKVLGVDLGDDLLPPVVGDNEKGYWEDRDINALNIAMMDHLNMSWDSLKILDAEHLKSLKEAGFHRRAHDLILEKTKQSNAYAFKDPRTIRLIDFWDEVCQTAGLNISYVIAVRNPRSVVDSLEQGRRVPREIGYSLWLLHTLECLVKTGERATVWVDYDAMLFRPVDNLNKMSERLGLSIHPQELLNFEEGFLERGLRHTVHDFDNLIHEPDSHQMIQEVYGICLDLCRDVNPHITVEIYERLVMEYQRLSDYFPALDSQWSRLKACQKQSFDQVRLLEEKDRSLEEKDSQLSGYEILVARQSDELTQSFNANKTLQAVMGEQARQRAVMVTQLAHCEALIVQQSDELRQSFNTVRALQSVTGSQSDQLSRLSAEQCEALHTISNLQLELTQLRDRFRLVEDKLKAMRLGERKIKVACFDSIFYNKANGNIASQGLDPLVHYLFQGQFEGRLAVPPNNGGGPHSVAGLIERLSSWVK
jgi:hypothetical protein